MAFSRVVILAFVNSITTFSYIIGSKRDFRFVILITFRKRFSTQEQFIHLLLCYIIDFKFEKKEFPKTSTYSLDFKPFPNAKPDVVLRKRLIASSEGHGTKNLIGMHNFDSSKNYITL